MLATSATESWLSDVFVLDCTQTQPNEYRNSSRSSLLMHEGHIRV